MTQALKKKFLQDAQQVPRRRPVFGGLNTPQDRFYPRTLGEAGADWADAATVNLLRIFLHGITEGDPHGWIAAFDVAEDLFDPQNGPKIATLAAKTVQAIRRNRHAGFRFNSPFCPNCAHHLTTEEAQVTVGLRALRLRQIDHAEIALRALCEGSAPTEITLWMRELAEALPALTAPTTSRLH